MALSANDLNIIHLKNLAILGKRYYGSDGRVYLGTKTGQLRLEDKAIETTFDPTVDIPETDVQNAIESLSNSDRINAQDAVGSILIDTTSIDFTFNSVIPSITADLTLTGVIAGTYGNSTNSARITVDSQGRITEALNVPIVVSPGSITLTSGNILVGNAGNVATDVTLSLSGVAGAFSLSNTGVLTMPDSGVATRGLLNSTDWNTFNNKVTSVSGTANRITSTGGTTPIIDIAATYVGQTSITTLGIISSGTWRGDAIGIAFGGTGNTTAITAFNALSPLTTKGDLLTNDGTNDIRKAVGADLKFLQASSADSSGLTWTDALVFPTTSTPARALNTNFTPSATRPTLVIYSISIEADDADDGKVELISDSAATPTTVRATIQNKFNVTGILGVAGESIITNVLTYIVTAGDNVRLVSTSTAGSPTFTIISQTEQTL